MAAGRKTGGRVKGTPNILTGQVKEMILSALDRAGGVDYLLKQSESNPTAFLTLVGKVLPLTVNGAADDGSHLVSLTWNVVERPND